MGVVLSGALTRMGFVPARIPFIVHVKQASSLCLSFTTSPPRYSASPQYYGMHPAPTFIRTTAAPSTFTASPVIHYLKGHFHTYMSD